jgi:hypothetical protein
MNHRVYLVLATVCIVFVILGFVWNFHFELGYEVSKKSEHWGHLGDYIGGLINPLLSFLALMMLIKSLSLQNNANIALYTEVSNNAKRERLRAFEGLFFNMIESQNGLFTKLRLKISSLGQPFTVSGVDAVLLLENYAESFIENDDLESLKLLLEDADSKDHLFSIVRVFYVIVKLVTERLSDENGFEHKDRKEHFTALINFTSYPHLRLILLYTQFIDFKPTEYLKNNKEFVAVFEELGLSFEAYS